MVLTLKVILQQADLDLPFTGGLGSFKLYVLVAHHIYSLLLSWGDDHPGEVLLLVLYRYGTLKDLVSYVDGWTTTPLDRGGAKIAEDGCAAELDAVYKLHLICGLCGLCYVRLLAATEELRHAVHSRNQAKSLVGMGVSADRL